MGIVVAEPPPFVPASTGGSEDGGEVIVICDQRHATRLALHRAQPRLGSVTLDGRELSQEEMVRADGVEEDWTPPFVSDPEEYERGVRLFIDMEGANEVPGFWQTCTRIVTDELLSAGVSHARLSTPNIYDRYSSASFGASLDQITGEYKRSGQAVFLPQSRSAEIEWGIKPSDLLRAITVVAPGDASLHVRLPSWAKPDHAWRGCFNAGSEYVGPTIIGYTEIPADHLFMRLTPAKCEDLIHAAGGDSELDSHIEQVLPSFAVRQAEIVLIHVPQVRWARLRADFSVSQQLAAQIGYLLP